MLSDLTDEQIRTLRTLVHDEIERVAELDGEDVDDEDVESNREYIEELRAIEYKIPTPVGVEDDCRLG